MSFFILGLVCFAVFFSLTSAFAIYEKQYADRIYPGIIVNSVDVSSKTKYEVEKLFTAKNGQFAKARFTLRYEDATISAKSYIATVSAQALQLGYNSQFIADQAYTIGRSGNVFADLFNKGRVWFGEVHLRPSYSLNRQALEAALAPLAKDVTITPVDAVFEMENDRVVAFRLSLAGQEIDMQTVEDNILASAPGIADGSKTNIEIRIIVKKREAVKLENINPLGIKEHIGQGTSRFTGSIPNRIHNIALAASRIDGTIVKPNAEFSFNDTVGDVSKLTGYKEAYIIKDGKTILGDGGGVCQVSTTLFRAALNSGLPITQRHSHSYRVGYYEQESAPGFDATVYAPSYDFRFKNDTEHALLIEAYTDTEHASLVFDIYGTSDGREVVIEKPVITDTILPPQDRYDDDPTLPRGVVKQVEYKAAGAKVVFKRTVTRDGAVLLSDSYTSNYRPWQAVYLRGTKE